MDAERKVPMPVSTFSRALLRGLANMPIPAPDIASPWAKALASLHQYYEDETERLARSKEGRCISRFRYHNAERRWMLTDIAAVPESRFTNPALHFAGFVCQQALCAYRLDMDFDDGWNASHIKQDIAKALAYANACGLGHDCPHMARLALVLSPYRKWCYYYDEWEEDRPRTGGFLPATIKPLVRASVDRVHDVTGHPRPRGCQYRSNGARS